MNLERIQGATVLVTGGTRGLGKAIGLEFARAGATVFLTHRWGSADEDELRAEFRAEDLPEPYIVESDVGDPDATGELMELIRQETGKLDVIVSNVAFSKIVHGLGDLKKSALDLSLNYSAWPIVSLVQAAHETFGAYPRYVLGISSDGGVVYYDGYDMAGASKAVLETFCRYLAVRLRGEGVRVNAVRPGILDTASSRATFGDDSMDTLHKLAPGLLLNLVGVARVCVALCSGYMDAVTGQVIVVDEGWSLVGPAAFVTGSVPKTFPEDA